MYKEIRLYHTKVRQKGVSKCAKVLYIKIVLSFHNAPQCLKWIANTAFTKSTPGMLTIAVPLYSQINRWAFKKAV